MLGKYLMLGKSLFSQLTQLYTGKIPSLCQKNPILSPEFHRSRLQSVLQKGKKLQKMIEKGHFCKDYLGYFYLKFFSLLTSSAKRLEPYATLAQSFTRKGQDEKKMKGKSESAMRTGSLRALYMSDMSGPSPLYPFCGLVLDLVWYKIDVLWLVNEEM